MTTPADKPDDASAVEPGAIDFDDAAVSLEAVKIRRHVADIDGLRELIDILIAAVEALRERVAELEGEIEQAIKWQQFYMNKAEAAEARVVELAAALAHLLEFADSTGQGCAKQVENARAVLAATPARAPERARAVEEVRQFIDDFESQFVCWDMMSLREHDEAVQHFLERASELTKLDALGKE